MVAVELSLERLKLGLDSGEGGLGLYILGLDFLQCGFKTVDSVETWVSTGVGGCERRRMVRMALRRTAFPWWPSWKISAQP